MNQAARDTVATPKPVDFSENEQPEPKEPGWFSRVFSKAKPEQRFQIQPKWARGCVKGCFFPLAKFSHPAWELTDEEAETVRPEMQTFLQAVFDKYVPGILNAWAARHSEFANLAMAMGVLAYAKFSIVRDAVVAEESARKVVEIPSPSEKTEKPLGEPPSSPNIPMLCGHCRKEFESRELYNAHFPCPGAN